MEGKGNKVRLESHVSGDDSAINCEILELGTVGFAEKGEEKRTSNTARISSPLMFSLSPVRFPLLVAAVRVMADRIA